MSQVIHWTEIEGFHNIRKYALAHPEILNGNSKVQYRAKVKLHGSNCAVQYLKDEGIVTQSRTSILTSEDDYAGFAKWVQGSKEWKDATKHMIFFGEWVGPGIQKADIALSKLPNKIFAVFAAHFINETDTLITEPEDLQALLASAPAYVLPWHGEVIEIDWLASDEELSKVVTGINDAVEAVEKNDPWVEAIFNVTGTGEGLVYYPVSKEHLGKENFKNLVFKAKGEKHRVVKTKASAQINADVAANVDQFVDMFLTEARLEQGTMAVMSDPVVAMLSFDVKLTGKFVAWIVNDVQKESVDELEAAKLEWAQVQKPLTEKARAWYLAKTKK